MHYHIHPIASLKDVQGILHIHDITWDKSTGILDQLRQSSDCYLIADEHGAVRGYAFIEIDVNGGGFAELNDIAIDPECRGKGLGRRLIQALMNDYSWIKLLASASKPDLLRFYRDLGFQEDAVFENYYGVDEDAVRFSWKRNADAPNEFP